MSESQSKLPALPKAFIADLDAYTPQLKLVLPDHIPVERFRRVVQTAVQLNPDLIGGGVNLATLWNACIRLAEMGLYPDGREAALVKYGSDIVPLPMRDGLLKLARNSGQLKAISAHVVYTNDDFEYRLGDDEHIHHVPEIDGERGELRCAYAIARLADDSVQREVMSKAEIAKVRAVSRAKKGGPWFDWESEMWRKTVLRRLIKYLPRAAEDERLKKALEADNEHYTLVEGTATEKVTPLPATKPRRLQAVKEAAKAKPEPTPPEPVDEEPDTSDIPEAGKEWFEGAKRVEPTQEVIPPQARQEPQEERQAPPAAKATPKPAAAPAPAQAPQAAQEDETVDVISEDGEPLTIAKHKTQKIVNALNSALREAATVSIDALDRVWEANQHLKAVMKPEDWKIQERAQSFRMEQLEKQQGLAMDDEPPPPPLGDE